MITLLELRANLKLAKQNLWTLTCNLENSLIHNRSILSLYREDNYRLDEDQEQKEIVVKAPSKPVVSSQKKFEKATEKALEEERYNVFQISKKIGKYVGIASTCVGIVLFVFLAYVSLTAQSNLTLSAFATSIPIISLWIFAGLISIIVGFLLMGRE